MNWLPKLQSQIAPWSAPIPSALAVALEAYAYTVGEANWWLALFAAVGAFVGIETVGAVSSYAALKLYRQGNRGIELAIALAGLLAYIASGFYTLAGTVMVVFFIMAPFAYFAYSVLSVTQEEQDQEAADREYELRRLREEKNFLNAKTRHETVSKSASPVTQTVSALTHQLDTALADDTDEMAQIRDWLTHPDGTSATKMAQKLGMSRSTFYRRVDTVKGGK